MSALSAAGAACDDLAVYRTGRPAHLPAEFINRLEADQIDWITLTSPSSFNNLLELLGEQRARRLGQVKLASIGPVTTEAIRRRGHTAAVEADPHDVGGLVEAIRRASSQQGGQG